MAEIGGKPILWHIMKTYSHYGFHDFIICCGYKGEVIKEYFLHYNAYQSDCMFQLKNKCTNVYKSEIEPWKLWND